MAAIKKRELEFLLVRGLYSKIKIKKINLNYYLLLYNDEGEHLIYYKNNGEVKVYKKRQNILDWLETKFGITNVELEL